MSARDIVDRRLRARLDEALDDTRVVVLQGARQVGKSTLADQVTTRRNGIQVTLDDPGVLAFAQGDPVGFVAQGGDRLLCIDEIQRAPELVVALKAEVDRDRRPGRFLVTGSANLLDLAATHESLAGRAEPLTLHSFSQGELDRSGASFVDAALAGRITSSYVGILSRDEYIARACSGGYPEALVRSGRRREDWLAAYVNQIVHRDAADISGLQRLVDLPRLLRLIAARAGSPMVWTGVANDAAIPRRTLDPYARLLETLYLTHTVPAWSTNLTARETKQPKVFVLDSGLAATLVGALPTNLPPGEARLGGLLEGFVVGELRRQLGWSDARAAMYHYRDSRGHEVDVVLEASDGRVVGIEVKAAQTIQAKDLRGLTLLRDSLGDRFVGGYVLNTGPRTQVVGERLVALPIDALWRV